MKKNILFEFVLKHDKIEEFFVQKSPKYRLYVIRKAKIAIMEDLKNPKQSLKEK